jgi:hypothetical protein
MMRIPARSLAIGAMAIPAAVVAIVSLRYLLPHPPSAPLNVMRNPFAMPWLPLHAVLSAIALLTGPFQLSGPNRRAARHRIRGRIYVACCLLSAPIGLLLAWRITTGPVATAGFGSLSIVWFAATALGYRAALERRFEAHRGWMIRSYALTFAAVTLRLYLAVALALHLDFDTTYRALSFLAWVPNLLVAELLLWRERTRVAP